MVSPSALNNAGRNAAFNRKKWSGYEINRLFCNVSRIVLDPRYRGASLAGAFLRAVVLQAPARYVELVTAMGAVSRFWERGGFIDYGPTNRKRLIGGQGLIYGKEGRHPGTVGAKVRAQSLTAAMRYYLADRDKVLSETVEHRRVLHLEQSERPSDADWL